MAPRKKRWWLGGRESLTAAGERKKKRRRRRRRPCGGKHTERLFDTLVTAPNFRHAQSPPVVCESARAEQRNDGCYFFFFPLVIVVSRAVIVVETKGHTHGYNGWIQHWCGRANRRKTDRATPSLSFHRAKRGNERNRVHKTARNSKCVDSIIQVRP